MPQREGPPAGMTRRGRSGLPEQNRNGRRKYTHGRFDYESGPRYGFTPTERYVFPGIREMDAEQYAAYCGTHCDHLAIPEPARTRFFEALRDTVRENGNRVIFRDSHVLYLTRRPCSAGSGQDRSV